MTATETMVCFHCAEPSVVDPEKSKPGETHYKPCSECGKVGIRREGDLYQRIERKKSFREAYDKSPYRGGRLA